MIIKKLQQMFLKRIQFQQNLRLINQYSQILNIKIKNYYSTHFQMYQQQTLIIKTLTNIFRIDANLRFLFFELSVKVFGKINNKYRPSPSQHGIKMLTVYQEYMVFFKLLNEKNIVKYMQTLSQQKGNDNRLLYQLMYILLFYLKITTQSIIQQIISKQIKIKQNESQQQPLFGRRNKIQSVDFQLNSSTFSISPTRNNLKLSLGNKNYLHTKHLQNGLNKRENSIQNRSKIRSQQKQKSKWNHMYTPDAKMKRYRRRQAQQSNIKQKSQQKGRQDLFNCKDNKFKNTIFTNNNSSAINPIRTSCHAQQNLLKQFNNLYNNQIQSYYELINLGDQLQKPKSRSTKRNINNNARREWIETNAKELINEMKKKNQLNNERKNLRIYS